MTLSDKADIGVAYAVTEGLNDIKIGIAVKRTYDRENPSEGLSEAATLIRRFATEAEGADSGNITVSLAGTADAPEWYSAI